MARRVAAGPKAPAKSELVLVGGEKAQVRKARKRDWTQKKEEQFLGTLAETCNVTLAAAAAGVSTTAAYNRRRCSAGFRAAWADAIGQAYHKLELVLLERALNGTEKVVTKTDGREERMREYPNQIALALLRMHRDTAVEAETEVAPDDIEEIRERLLRKLERVRLREEEKAKGGTPESAA